MSTAEKKRKGMSIRAKLILYLACFSALILLVFWFFQIFMLDRFYEWSKKDQMKKTLSQLEQSLREDEAEDMELLLNDLAKIEQFNITLYRVEGQELIRVSQSQSGLSGRFKGMDPKVLYDLYEQAFERSDRILTLESKPFEGEEKPGEFEKDVSSETRNEIVFDENGNPVLPEGVDPFRDMDRDRNASALFMMLATDNADGVSYAITIDATMTPLESTVQTLQRQFFLIAAIVILCGLVLSLLLSHIISKPIVKMNQSAKKLAKGHYDADFSTGGFKEVSELSESLDEASSELSKVDSLQKELIATISHDLRTPLTMVKGYAEAVRDLPGEDTPENMQVIIDEATRMSELVNDLLDLSRLESGVRTLQLERFDLTSLISEVMFRYEKLTSHDGYKILFEPSGEAFVRADRTLILQVVYNFINNAINYTGDDLTVRVREILGDRTVRIDVEDSGEGIPEQQIPQIWDRYYKVDKVHRRTAVGSGLGLSICKKILLSHNAAFGVESTLGKGSVFWFELPLDKGDATQS